MLRTDQAFMGIILDLALTNLKLGFKTPQESYQHSNIPKSPPTKAVKPSKTSPRKEATMPVISLPTGTDKAVEGLVKSMSWYHYLKAYLLLFLTGPSSLWGNHESSDLEVVCGDQTFKVHSIIVCPRSEFFKAAFYGRFKVNFHAQFDRGLSNGVLGGKDKAHRTT